MKFVCDVMLGKLAKFLRLLGLDAEYAKDEASLRHHRLHSPDRILLTRRTRGRGFVTSIRITSDNARAQLLEIKDLLRPVVDRSKVLNRCIECNVELADTDKSEIEALVPEFVFHHYSRFKICPSCRRVYWEGSHATGMENLVREIISP